MRTELWTGFWLLAVIWGLAFPAVAAGPELSEIRFEKGKDGSERVLFVLNGEYLPKTFPIEGKKPRLICDFFDVRPGGKVRNFTRTGGNLIKSIRVGIHLLPVLKTRVVLDLHPDKDYEISQAFFSDEKIYALILKCNKESTLIQR